MQCLPVLKKLYPEHWVFERHPLFALSDPPEEWEAWESVQWDVFKDVERHIHKHRNLQLPRTPSYLPPRWLKQRAGACGATWATEVYLTHMELNPGRGLALMEASRQDKQVRTLKIHAVDGVPALLYE